MRITTDDVERFAAASGDHNPLHLDPVFARRTAFGQPVVHGALAAVALLGCLPAGSLAALRRLRVSFAGPVLPGVAVAAAVGPDARRPDRWWGTLSARGKQLLRLEAWSGGEAPPEPRWLDVGRGGGPMRDTPADVELAAVAAGDEVAGEYGAGAELAELARRWDAQALDPGLLEALAWSSYVVGMELPGLRSLLAGLRLSSPGSAAPGPARHRIRVVQADPRTGRLLLEGRLAGPAGPRAVASIEAFGRPRSVARAPIAASSTAAAQGAVVVVGGSRGFGAALVLSLLEAGYGVHALYAVSRDAAEELRPAAGAHVARLSLHQVDARDASGVERVAAAVRESGEPLRGVVLNAAPPPLGMRVTSASAKELADYVSDSLGRVAVPLGGLLPLLGRQGAWMLFSSTAAMAEPPLEWPHYLAAKGAMEGLARWAAAARPDARVVVFRAPKMQTDLTSSPSGAMGAVSADAVAHWLVGRIAGDALHPGFNVVDPPAPA